MENFPPSPSKSKNAKQCEKNQGPRSKRSTQPGSKDRYRRVQKDGTYSTIPGGIGGKIKPLPLIDGSRVDLSRDLSGESNNEKQSTLQVDPCERASSLTGSPESVPAVSPAISSSSSDSSVPLALDTDSNTPEDPQIDVKASDRPVTSSKSQGSQATGEDGTVTPSPILVDSSAIQAIPQRGPPRGGGKRVSKAEVILRLRIVEGLMLRGYMGRDVQNALERHFKKKVPWTTVQKYVRHIAKMWEEEDALMRPYRRARQLRQLHEAADDVRSEGVTKEWIELQRLIARIEGNEAPEQKEITVRSKFEGWSVQELEAYAQDRSIPQRLQSGRTGREESQLPDPGEGESNPLLTEGSG